MAEIYGVDTSKKINPLMVRDAIIKCFYEAHCLEQGINFKKDYPANKEYCTAIIKQGFQETGGDFNNPDKQSIISVLNYLVNFSKDFRKPEVVRGNYDQVMSLVNKL